MGQKLTKEVKERKVQFSQCIKGNPSKEYRNHRMRKELDNIEDLCQKAGRALGRHNATGNLDAYKNYIAYRKNAVGRITNIIKLIAI